MTRLLLAIGFLIGALVPVQGAANARLGATLGHPGWAAVFSLAIGAACVGVGLLVVRAPFPDMMSAAGGAWWAWSGGLVGSLFIVAAIVLLPRVGAASFAFALMAGQLASATAMDRFGLFGLASRPVTGWRIAAVSLVLAGLAAIAVELAATSRQDQ